MSNFIRKAIKHPGIEKAKARRNGVSTHTQLERDAHSSNPSVRGRGLLGLRFEGYHGGISGKKKKAKPKKLKGKASKYSLHDKKPSTAHVIDMLMKKGK